MPWKVSAAQRVFISFLLFGLLNNILYVVILTAAVDVVGYAIPKAVVLLADIMPSLIVKLLAPFFIQKLQYSTRIWLLVFFSCCGMILVGFSGEVSLSAKVLGISMASLSSGLGEVSFLQLTQYYDEKKSIGGFSMGTGGAGLLGSFSFMMMTNVLGLSSWVALAVFSLLPFVVPVIFYFLLPHFDVNMLYEPLFLSDVASLDADLNCRPNFQIVSSSFHGPKEIWVKVAQQFHGKIRIICPLIRPYMMPLCSVYIAEYVINQGISPTLLFPLSGLPKWLFSSYRDIYVVYGFFYQFGVFLSRSSLTLGFRFRGLYLLSFLQTFNLVVVLYQSLYDSPFTNVLPVLILIFYEGLLGGLLYVNAFMNVSQDMNPTVREFSMACVSMSDSFGIMIAGFVNLWLENSLCARQVNRGKNWCKLGS